jgi:GT2 family glycosyltransferase
VNYIIVTNTFKRSPELVSKSLRSSLAQKIPPVKVILIDQNNEELSLPDDILNNPLFLRQRVTKHSVSEARNMLQIPFPAEWILFCDDDGYPCEDYSERFAGIIARQKDIEILAGSIVRIDNKEYYSLRHKKGGSLKYFRNTKNLMGSNFVIKSKTFDELGRFDENFGVGAYWGSSEETDFCWKAYFAGKKMEYFPELIVYHIPPFNESVKTGFKKAFFYGVGKGALVGKWLFKRRKIKVLYELIEMFIVPFIQSIRGLIALRFALIPTNFAALSGRIYGMIKYLFVSR